MPLSWITRPKAPASIDELVEAGKYGKAVARLREQFSRRYPSTEERQRYAEVLVLAGRGEEAVPVLLGIADEQERYGFPEKALEALHRAAEIDPEQAEVKERLESIHRAPESPRAPETTPPIPGAPETTEGWDPALDGAFAPHGTAAQPSERVALDADVAGSSMGASGAATIDDALPTGAAAVHETRCDDGNVAVVADPGADGRAATSPPAGPVAADAAADEGEITARSLHVDPEVLGEPEPDAAPDEGEITARSLMVDPAILGDPEGEETVDEGEITARSLLVDPEVLGGTGSEARDEGEITARSLLVDPAVFGTGDGRPDPETAEREIPLLLLPEEDLEPEEDLNEEEVEELTAEEIEIQADARALLSGRETRPGGVPSFDVLDELDQEVDARTLAPGAPEGDDPTPLLIEEDLHRFLTADAEALLASSPTQDGPGWAEDEDQLEELLTVDARALLSGAPTGDDPEALTDEEGRDQLLATDARALLSGGPRKDEPVAAPRRRETVVPAGNARPTAGSPTDPASAAPTPAAGDAPEARVPEGTTGEAVPPPAVHPDETHVFLSEEDLVGLFTDQPPSNGNGTHSRAASTPSEKAVALATRTSPTVEEEAEAADEEQAHQLAG